MPRPRTIEVEKHLTREELEQLISEKPDPRLKERLIFIRILYDGERVKDAANKVGRSKPTGYHWLHRWNENGIGGLKPDFGGGRPPKLSNEEKQELEEILRKRNDWTLKEIRTLIAEKFGVKYSRSHLSRILRSMGMNCGKPYQKDYRRPENAEEKLKERLDKTLENINSALEEEEKVIIGFLDESRPKTTSNTVRVWAFGGPEKRRNTTGYQANTFGFYPLNGKGVVEFKESSKKERVCEVSREDKKREPGRKDCSDSGQFRIPQSQSRQRESGRTRDRTGLPPALLTGPEPDRTNLERNQTRDLHYFLRSQARVSGTDQGFLSETIR